MIDYLFAALFLLQVVMNVVFWWMIKILREDVDSLNLAIHRLTYRDED